MACGVAMKRPHDLDSLINAEPSVKRSRTSWLGSPQHHCGSTQQLLQQRSPNHANTSSIGSMTPHLSNTPEPKAEPDELDVRLISEIHSVRRRRSFHQMRGNQSPMSSNSDSDSEQRMETSSGLSNKMVHKALGDDELAKSFASAMRNERPIFSYKEMRVLCERLLKEQELNLREEYDKTLNAKLAEQYDTFVRFTYDQIHRRLDDTPMSYLS